MRPSPHALVFGLATLLVAGASLSAAHGLHVRPDALPCGDVGSYVIRASRNAELLAAGDLAGLLDFVAEPQMHPPGHSLVLGLWILAFGASQLSTQTYGAVAMAVMLAGVALLAREAMPKAGAWAVAGAVVLVATARLTLNLSWTAMSEPSSLGIALVGLWTLCRALQRPGWGWQLLAGLLVLLASVTRYNFLPMLLAPALTVHLWQHWRSPRALFDPRKLLWLLPTAMLFALWVRAEPGLLRSIRGFVVNVDSGHDPMSWEYLGFVPRSWPTWIWLSLPVCATALGLALVGLIPALLRRELRRSMGPLELVLSTSPGLLCIQAFALWSALALTAHPYKLVRNLLLLVPALALAALLPWARTRLRPGSPAGLRLAVPLGLLLLMGLGTRSQLSDAASRRTLPLYLDDAATSEVLDTLAEHASDRSWLLVSGWVRPYEPHLFELGMAERGSEATVVVDWTPGSTEGRRNQDLGLPLPRARVEELMVPQHAGDLTVALFEQVGRPARGKFWPEPRFVKANSATMRPYLLNLGFHLVDRIELEDQGARIYVWEAGS